jgi:hypothetical protein
LYGYRTAEHSKYIDVGKRVVNRLWLTSRWHWLAILMLLVASLKASLRYLCRIPSVLLVLGLTLVAHV